MRRTIVAGVLAFACLVLPWATGGSPPAVAAPERPNIVLIVTDDQREGFEVMPKTIARIRNSGVELSNAYATTPNCCPSRSSIFTGQYSHNHGVFTNGSARELDQSTTIQRYLKEANYFNGLFGKFLNGWNIEKAPPHFHDFAMLKTGSTQPRYYGSTWNVNGTIDKLQSYTTTYLEHQAMDFLSDRDAPRRDARPWFLYMAPNAPHAPAEPAAKYKDATVPPWNGNPAVFETDKSDKPLYVQNAKRTFEDGKRQRTKQLRTLMSVDDLVEDLYLRLAKLDELQDTIVMFMSDNGIMWAEHGLGKKRVPYPEATSIPFLLSWPGHVAPGTTDARLVGNIDVAPTIVDALDLGPALDHKMDGRSLLDQSWDRDRLLIENWGLEFASTVTPDYQYTEYYDATTGATKFREYYDMDTDPWQLTNLFGDGVGGNDPAISPLTEQLNDDRDCVGTACP